MRDIALNATEDFPLFTTRVDTGAPTDVSGIVVSAYPDNSATQITAGITVSSPDSIAGYANVRVVATVANGYAYNTHYTLVITTGTVNSVSVVGAIVGEFTIRRNVPGLVRAFIAQASTSTTLVFDSATSFADNFLNGHFVYIVAGTGAGQSRVIDSWVSSTDTATVSPAWTTTPDTTSICECYATPPASTGALPGVDVQTIKTQAVTAAAGVTFPTSIASPTNITAGTITTVTNLTNAPTSGDFTATMKTSIGTAVAASAVASVTAPVSLTGDFTATMKTSIGTAVAASAVASVTAAVSITGDLSATMKTSTQTAAQAALTASGITTANGITKIAGVALQTGGTGGQGIGA